MIGSNRAKSQRGRAIAALLAGTVLQPAGMALAQQAEEATPPLPPAPEGEFEIVVRGLRASLTGAADAKRKADDIREVVDAEDIGKLPDTNVAESLQRVTGVQIDRELGEGSEIAIRGFSENRIELNGETQVGTGAGGNVTFRTIPSEAFSRIEVIKTPSADQVEGSLGALVRFSTRKPLDLKRPILSLGGDVQYAQRADKWAPDASLTLADKWKLGDGDFGAILTATYKSRRLRQDFFEVRGWEAVNGIGRDLDRDGVIGEPVERGERGIITNLQDGVYVPLLSTIRVREQNRRLFSLTGGLQYRPIPSLEFYYNSTFTKNVANDHQYQYGLSFNGALEDDPVASGNRLRAVYQDPANIRLTANQTVIAAMLGQINPTNQRPQRGVNMQIAGNANPIDEQTFSFNTGMRWDATDRLKIELQFARGVGHKINDQTFTNAGLINFNDNPFAYFDFGTGSDIPTMIALQRANAAGTATTAPTADNRIDFLDPNAYRLNGSTHQVNDERDYDRAWRADLDWTFDGGLLTSVEAGVRLGLRRGQRSRQRADDTIGLSTDGTLAGMTFPQLEAAFPGLIAPQPYDDILNGASGDFAREWLSLDTRYLADNLAHIREAGGIVLRPDTAWGFDVSQRTTAAYLKLNYGIDLGSLPISGNLGLRYAHTDQVATGAYTVRNLNPVVATYRQSYDNWLPSFNLRAALARRLVLRLGAASAMSRPQPSAVAPLIDVNFSADRGNGGNPLLTPQRITQFDLALERYWGTGNSFAVGFFYKDFKQRIEQGVQRLCFALPAGAVDPDPNDGCAAGEQLIPINTQVNSGGAKVKGVEVAWQQQLTFLPAPLDGLGFVVNYTFTDAQGGTSRSDSGRLLPFQDLSRHSYNLIAFYEKGPLQLRGSYSWRSVFYDDRSDAGEASMAAAYGQFDASMSYDLTRNITVSVEGLNLLNAPERRYQELIERPLIYRVNDRRVLFGLRLRS